MAGHRWPTSARAAVAAVLVTALALLGRACVMPAPAEDRPWQGTDHSSDLTAATVAAVSYARVRGVRTGVAVLDLHSGEYAGAGDAGLFGAASVVKVLIAVRLLAAGGLAAPDAALLTSMIVDSDDRAASILWPRAGGADLIGWVESYYQLPLGSPNIRPNIWGSTQITAKGMVFLYRAIARDPVVGPWLMDAMRRCARIAADGTDQFFGIPAVTTRFAVKQGWGARSAQDPANAVAHTTGYVNADRFAVAILAEGSGYHASTDHNGFSVTLADVVTAQARLVLTGLAPTTGSPVSHVDINL